MLIFFKECSSTENDRKIWKCYNIFILEQLECWTFNCLGWSYLRVYINNIETNTELNIFQIILNWSYLDITKVFIWRLEVPLIL